MIYVEPLPDTEAHLLKPWGAAFGGWVQALHDDPALRFVPGRARVLSRRLLYTADSATLDALLSELLADEWFPADVVLTGEGLTSEANEAWAAHE